MPMKRNNEEINDMSTIHDYLLDKPTKSADNNASSNSTSSLVPTLKDYEYLSDSKNINNKRTIDYTEGIRNRRNIQHSHN